MDPLYILRLCLGHSSSQVLLRSRCSPANIVPMPKRNGKKQKCRHKYQTLFMPKSQLPALDFLCFLQRHGGQLGEASTDSPRAIISNSKSSTRWQEDASISITAQHSHGELHLKGRKAVLLAGRASERIASAHHRDRTPLFASTSRRCVLTSAMSVLNTLWAQEGEFSFRRAHNPR